MIWICWVGIAVLGWAVNGLGIYKIGDNSAEGYMGMGVIFVVALVPWLLIILAAVGWVCVKMGWDE